MRLPYPEPDWRAGIKSRKPAQSTVMISTEMASLEASGGFL